MHLLLAAWSRCCTIAQVAHAAPSTHLQRCQQPLDVGILLQYFLHPRHAAVQHGLERRVGLGAARGRVLERSQVLRILLLPLALRAVVLYLRRNKSSTSIM